MKPDSENQVVNQNYEDLFGFPVDSETLFSDYKGRYKKRIEKRQTKLLKKASFLKKFLQEDEKVLLITTACSPTSFFEQYLTGWIFLYIKRSLLIFTNKRIFHIPTKQDYSYRNSIARIMYPDCDSIQVKGRHLVVKYKNGEKEKFLYLAGKEKKKIKALLLNISFEGSPSETQKRSHLCPSCTKRLEEGKYICPSCYLKFKDKDKGRKISILYPGGGYFYTEHPFLGISDAIGETMLIIFLILAFIDMMNGVKGRGVYFVILAILLTIEKATSVYHSNHFIKEYIPVEKEINAVA